MQYRFAANVGTLSIIYYSIFGRKGNLRAILGKQNMLKLSFRVKKHEDISTGHPRRLVQ